uniref:Uncharacterized protein n=1 Tax=Picea glauca TaxID=3330 RepID=A0A101LU18_PICGL|nr:hypothetical protein ABT39_MTgene2652 [Picea glauca]
MRTSKKSNCKSNCLQRPCVPWNKHKRLDLSWQYLRNNGEGQHPVPFPYCWGGDYQLGGDNGLM